MSEFSTAGLERLAEAARSYVGRDGGLGTSFLVDPVRGLVVIVLTQRLWETSQAPAVHTDIQAVAYAALR